MGIFFLLFLKIALDNVGTFFADARYSSKSKNYKKKLKNTFFSLKMT